MTLTVVNPATEQPIAELEQAGVEETDAAVTAAKAFSSSRHRLEWMWQELPIHPWSGFAMNVIERPFRCAISLAPFL